MIAIAYRYIVKLTHKQPNHKMNGKGKYWKPGSAQPTAEKITESSTKATLSKGVLGMKFMKR